MTSPKTTAASPLGDARKLMTWTSVLGAMAIAPAYLHLLELHDHGYLLSLPAVGEEPVYEVCAVASLSTGLLVWWLLQRAWRWEPGFKSMLGLFLICGLFGGINAGLTLGLQALFAGHFVRVLPEFIVGTFLGTLFLIGSAPGAALGLGFIVARLWTERLFRRAAPDAPAWVSLGLGLWLVSAAATAMAIGPVDIRHPLGPLALLAGLGHMTHGLARLRARRSWLRRVAAGRAPGFAIAAAASLERELDNLPPWRSFGPIERELVLVRHDAARPYRDIEAEAIAWLPTRVGTWLDDSTDKPAG